MGMLAACGAAPPDASPTSAAADGEREDSTTTGGTNDDDDTAPDASSGSQDSTGGTLPGGTSDSTSSSGAPDSDDASETEDTSTTGIDDDAQPSAACGASDLQPGDHSAIAMDHGGMARSYDLFLPVEHDGQTPVPLVLNFHGWTQSPAGHADFSQMTMTAADRGFALVYPEGIDTSWNAGICCGGAQSQGLDDVGFVRAMMFELGQTVCFDQRRVYAVGHSNGGFLAHRLACEASDLFAAIASIAGVLGIPPEECTPGRAMPLLHLHGTADPIVAYEGGGALGQPSAFASSAGWAARNGCDNPPQMEPAQGDLSCQAWTGCAADAEVRLCDVEGMGHCWPGNPECTWGPSSTSFHASDMVADFFSEHVRPPR